MRVLIVDDEPLARRGVALRLAKFRDVELVGECGDGVTALQKIVELAPDLLFLDVQMPGMDGFEVLRALPTGSMPGVIFLTAFEQHALRAFEFHALDYLLKPVDDERFTAAVARARKLLHAAAKAEMGEKIAQLLSRETNQFVSRFSVRTGTRIEIVSADDVDWIGAAGDYVELHAGGRSHLLRETMSALEQKLDPARFVRIHRSRIVRSENIRALRSIENREYMVKLADGSEHRSGRTYADRLEQWLSCGKN